MFNRNKVKLLLAQKVELENAIADRDKEISTLKSMVNARMVQSETRPKQYGGPHGPNPVPVTLDAMELVKKLKNFPIKTSCGQGNCIRYYQIPVTTLDCLTT